MSAEPDVCDGIDLKWMYTSDSEEEEDWYSNSPVILTQEVSLKGKVRRILFRNSKTRLGSTLFDIIVKFSMCVLYCIRIQLDDVSEYGCGGNPCSVNSTFQVLPDNEEDGMKFSSAEINWPILLWVHRPKALWIVEVVLATFTFSKALLFIFISKLGKIELMTKPAFILEILCSLPLMATVCYPVRLKNLYVPIFLNCWLAKIAMERLFNDLHLTKQKFQTISVTMSQQLLILAVTLICLIFTTVCGIQHIQRASTEKPLTIFEAFYFVIVTFSTVGYGDISPDIWLGQLFMVLMICIAIGFIPRQIEGIASIWIERQKGGGEYSLRQAKKNRHVVVCAKNLGGDALMDFLSEFYSNPKHVEYNVILLCSDEQNSSMHMILRDPKWANRVIYMRGSALKEADLKRCRMNEAEACFILPPDNCSNKEQEDQHTIMRSWAVKDFCPSCNQFIQLFRTENKIHVKFAEHVVCEDEFTYALLANNCLYPGLSTLVSLLVHTSTGYEGELATEPWMQLYGRHSGMEIYHIQLSRSIFFRQYEGSSFTEASGDAHFRYGVSLVGILDTENDDHKIILNPGPTYTLKGSDFCFYMSTTKEEYSRIKHEKVEQSKKKTQRERNYEKIAGELQKFLEKNEPEDYSPAGEESVFNTITSQRGFDFSSTLQSSLNPTDTPDILHRDAGDSVRNNTQSISMYNDLACEEFITGAPPTFLTGSKKTICHLVRNRRHACCLRWGEDCGHVKYKKVNDSRWQNNLIILSADKICVGIYNFIVPLRSKFISVRSISPIILMLEEEPPAIYVDSLANFPLVYWMKGSTKNLDDLLRAGINKASHIVIVNRSSNLESEVVLTDSETIVAVQSIFKWFPHTNILTEISQKSNIKFMQFQPHDEYSQKIARLEKKLKENMRSSLTHIFRLPFAAGHVFSCSMLDTLLYQTFSKGYLIKFVRLLLGIDAEENSGHLSSIKVKRDILLKYKTYGELYKGLCEVTGEVPIAIYRTETRKHPVIQDEEEFDKSQPLKTKKLSLNLKQFYEKAEQNDLSDFVKTRMTSLCIDTSGYSCEDEPVRKPLSYIISNPHPHCRLRRGDIIYVIQPSAMFAVPSRMGHKRHAKRRQSWTEGVSSTTIPLIEITTPRSRHASFTDQLPGTNKNVTFTSPETKELTDTSPLISAEMNHATPEDMVDSVFPKTSTIDPTCPKTSTTKTDKVNPPIFNFSFMEKNDDSSPQSSINSDFSSVNCQKNPNTTNNNDIEMEDLGGATNDREMQAPPKIVVTRTPTKVFTTERVNE